MGDSGGTPFKGRRVVHARPVEHTLWTLRKGTRVAEARTRQHPLGPELLFYVNGELLWSQVFREAGASLGAFSELKRSEFQPRLDPGYR